MIWVIVLLSNACWKHLHLVFSLSVCSLSSKNSTKWPSVTILILPSHQRSHFWNCREQPAMTFSAVRCSFGQKEGTAGVSEFFHNCWQTDPHLHRLSSCVRKHKLTRTQSPLWLLSMSQPSPSLLPLWTAGILSNPLHCSSLPPPFSFSLLQLSLSAFLHCGRAVWLRCYGNFSFSLLTPPLFHTPIHTHTFPLFSSEQWDNKKLPARQHICVAAGGGMGTREKKQERGVLGSWKVIYSSLSMTAIC